MIHRSQKLLLLALILCAGGCAMVESPKVAARRVTRMFTPNPTDWDSEVNQDTSEWDFVGDEGRRDVEREKDPDPWYKNFLMSQKANSIERNLGID
jgi:hypothetical protein